MADSTQLTNTLLLVSPDFFGFNQQTAPTNAYQHDLEHIANVPALTIRDKAVSEFNQVVKTLQAEGVEVVAISSPDNTPDAVFPNNWFSTHKGEAGAKLVIYPMLAPNRRLERQPKKVIAALEAKGYQVAEVIDLTRHEANGLFLEGTGSLVLDRQNRIAYAGLTPRANRSVAAEFARLLGYELVAFTCTVYHTNFILSVGEGFAVVCPDAIPNQQERELLLAKLSETGKEIVEISVKQIGEYCGNILQVLNKSGEKLIIMSTVALKSFTEEQRAALKKHGKFVALEMQTIEEVGGGSARCLLVEIFA